MKTKPNPFRGYCLVNSSTQENGILMQGVYEKPGKLAFKSDLRWQKIEIMLARIDGMILDPALYPDEASHEILETKNEVVGDESIKISDGLVPLLSDRDPITLTHSEALQLSRCINFATHGEKGERRAYELSAMLMERVNTSAHSGRS